MIHKSRVLKAFCALLSTMLVIYIVLMIALYLFVSKSYAATTVSESYNAVFTWIPNTEPYLRHYEIYCDKVSQKDNPHKHAMWRSARKDNIKKGRVEYVWNNFPNATSDHYCVAVAVGVDKDGKKLVSAFSKEIKVPKMVPPRTMDPPDGVKVVIVNVNVTVN